MELLSFRKKQLRKQISEAKELGEQDKFFGLRAQWVHRYGIETLEEPEHLIKIQEIQPLEKEQSYEIETCDEYQIPEGDNQCFDSVEEDCFEGLTCLNSSLNERTVSDQKLDDVFTKPSSDALPPPIPSLNHFRRWLPSVEDEMPKAS
ncbi:MULTISPECIES: hypothetical protein [unclassified Prochlorococcus]|uniref:hypothetical protein n=1 Tax=unclassified Prochlorococcus TaxID=2627481 RepID=UPI000533974E|nr:MULTISPECIES: hypothetical protein [unclassified Prochlorococcus]KGG16509.1 hypothetical protein EV06_0350 [Prochlorococcus sp. MIT 0602]KGG17015.1 hypothetical protein EV07_0443 [Prochlorococcus sp. MIT 0603]